jgi:hypothetical protein
MERTIPNLVQKSSTLRSLNWLDAAGVEDGAGALAETGRSRLGECIEDDLGAHVIGQCVAEDP